MKTETKKPFQVRNGFCILFDQGKDEMITFPDSFSILFSESLFSGPAVVIRV